MVVVPVRDMSGKSETLVETPPAIMENGNSVKLAEEKMMICSSNCEDNTFDDTPTVLKEKQIMTCTNNSEDTTFHMEGSPSAHDHPMPSKASNEDVEVDIVDVVKPDEERVADHAMPSMSINEDVEADIVQDLKPEEQRVAHHTMPSKACNEDVEVVIVEAVKLDEERVADHTMPSKASNEDVEVDIVGDVKPDEERVADHTTPSKANNEDVEVDIVGDVKERVVKRESQDVTESSSSFGSTDSGAGSAAVSSDMEVESQACDGHASLLRFDGFSDLYRTRKKKLRAHWRNFVRPVMWRCKWVELQLRELHSQVSKYDRELAECERKKQCGLEKGATEDLGIKSAPFISQNRPVKLMKRKKRKRVEETVDLASYTSSHSLFSYYACKRPFAGSACIDDDHSNNDMNAAKKNLFGGDEFGITGGWTHLESKDSDAFESILRKIDEAQLQVSQLRTRMDKVVREHAGKFTSDGSSLAPDDPSANCNLNSVPHVNIEKTPFASVCTTSRQGQVNSLPDMVESTDQPQIEGRCEKTGNGILMHDRPVKEEVNNAEEVGIQHAEPPSGTEGEAGDVRNVTDPNSASQMPVAQEQISVKTRSVSKLITPKNKRKRGRRKARSGRWSRRSSG